MFPYSHKYLPWFIFAGLLALGLAIRLIDIQDPPLGFNPTRQLRSAIIARGLYYQSSTTENPMRKDLALSHLNAMERLEPRILERLVAWTYLAMGGENLWVARVYSSLIWLVGGVVVFNLSRQIGSVQGALVGLGYYLLLPFSIFASRSFQPDPLMVLMILLTTRALFHWTQTRSWRWTFVAGTLAGLAGFVKVVALFFVGSVVIAMALGAEMESEGNGFLIRLLRALRKLCCSSQVWTMAVLLALPAVLYYLLTPGDDSSLQSFFHWTIINRWREVLSPSFYMRWLIHLNRLFSLPLVLISVLGIAYTTKFQRSLLVGLLGGYALSGLFFPYHIITHDYYSLALVPIVALSLAPLAGLLFQKLAGGDWFSRLIQAWVLFLAVAYPVWMARSILVGQDFSAAPAYWEEVGNSIPPDAKAIAATQDFGFRLIYFGWRKTDLWPKGAGVEEFSENVGDAEYFIVTAKGQLGEGMGDFLEESFPIHTRGGGYVVYDIQP